MIDKKQAYPIFWCTKGSKTTFIIVDAHVLALFVCQLLKRKFSSPADEEFLCSLSVISVHMDTFSVYTKLMGAWIWKICVMGVTCVNVIIKNVEFQKVFNVYGPFVIIS